MTTAMTSAAPPAPALAPMVAPEAMALFSPAFPCNPRPFARAIGGGCEQHGTSYIETDEAKAILNILIQMSYGQCASVDTLDEYERLKTALNVA